MSRIIGLFLLLAAAVWLAAQFNLHPSRNDHVMVELSPWRRTSVGWERSDFWGRPNRVVQPSAIEPTALPHPALLALIELLAASLCLLACPTANASKTRQQST